PRPTVTVLPLLLRVALMALRRLRVPPPLSRSFLARVGTALAVAFVLAPCSSSATDEPSESGYGQIVVVKPATLMKFVAAPVGGTSDLPALPAHGPSVEGGPLAISGPGSTAGSDTYALAAGLGWTGLGQPPGSTGWKYRGAGSLTDPCKTVLIKPTVIKA